MPGPLELGLILVAVALIFGAQRLPELMRGLGRGLREFRAETADLRVLTAPTQPTATQPAPPWPITLPAAAAPAPHPGPQRPAP